MKTVSVPYFYDSQSERVSNLFFESKKLRKNVELSARKNKIKKKCH